MDSANTIVQGDLLIKDRRITAVGASGQTADTVIDAAGAYLRVTVRSDGSCQFSWSRDGLQFTTVGAPFAAREGKWIGAKVGLFAVGPTGGGRGGHAEFDALVFDR